MFKYLRPPQSIAIGACILLCIAGRTQAAISWDSQGLTTGLAPAGDGTQWWFDPFNWSGTGNNPGDTAAHFLPPSLDNAGSAANDTQINTGTRTLPGGEGVVYYPNLVGGDPNFATAGSYAYPTGGYGPQVIRELYISRNTTNENLLTIKGDLTVGLNPPNTTAFQVGRSGSTATSLNLGSIVQATGTVSVPSSNLDIGQAEASGWGNGIYDYRGGILDVYNNTTGHGIRLSPGGTTNGSGGVGRLIMHNPATPGYVRTYSMAVAAERTLADGLTRGVGVVEFHYENGNTRPIQVMQNISINNGLDSSATPSTTRSSRLSLILDAAPTVDGSGVPQMLPLIDVNSQGLLGGVINGTGDLDGDGTTNNDRIFSSADGTKNYYPRSAWTRSTLSSHPQDDFLVSAIYNGIVYKWEVSYTGNITFTDPNAGTIGSVSDTGGVDVVLKGVSSGPATTVPGDYNNNGIVDAGDYDVWRKNRLTDHVLPNDPFGPMVVDSQYNLWKSNFGKTPGPGSGTVLNTGAVPEPGTMFLFLAGLISVSLIRRKR
jgi:hypothetical protein